MDVGTVSNDSISPAGRFLVKSNRSTIKRINFCWLSNRRGIAKNIEMNDESNFVEKSGSIPRRDFLKDTIFAAGAAAIFPFSLNGQTKMDE